MKVISKLDTSYYLNAPLIEASRVGHAGNVEDLLIMGADVHAQNEMPLRVAALNGHENVIRKLCFYGADFTLAILYAQYENKNDEIENLLKYMPQVMIIRSICSAARALPTISHTPDKPAA